MKRPIAHPILLASLLFLSVAAGCLQADPATNGTTPAPAPDADADADEGAEDALPEDAAGSVTPEDAYATMRDAFAALEDEGDAGAMPDRWSMRFTVTSHHVDAPGEFEFGAFADEANGVVFMAMEGEGLASFADDEMLGGLFGGGGFIAGQVWKTTFFGPMDNLLVLYNASADPAEGWTALESGDTASTAAFRDDLLDSVQDVDADAVQEVGFVTHNGKRALEVKIDDGNGTTTTTGRVLVYTEPAFPALVELHVTNPDAEGVWERDATLVGAFDHGPSATHPLLDTLLRFETMAFMSVQDAQGAFAFADTNALAAKGDEWTIQPTHFPEHRATLDAVTAIARPAESADGTELRLPLEEGRAENADVRLTFTDADGDGRVSTGDVIALAYLSDAGASYSVTLLDEASGLLLTPFAGVPGAFLALALAGFALAARRERR